MEPEQAVYANPSLRKRPRVYSDTTGPSKTQQHERDSCDINLIISKYATTGLLGRENAQKPHYGDFTTSGDYLIARNQLLEADAIFAALPSDIRKKFQNNPSELIGFIDDPSNRDEAIELGLLPKPIHVPTPPPEPATPPQKETETPVPPAES